MDEEAAARRLATAKARLILAEASTDPAEFAAALLAVEKAEADYTRAVNS